MDAPHDPRALAEHYRAARVHERLLLTGHSHQAWPDVARDGQLEAFDDATALVDEKWERAFAKATRVQDGWLRWLGDDGSGVVTLGDSTHTLLVRLMSALDWAARPRVVTTDGEFHSARRQLARLAETGVEVVRVPAQPVATLAERVAARVDDRTAMVLVSKVLFGTASVVPGLAATAAAARRHGTVLVVDTYHALGALDWSLGDDDLLDAFAVGGGYKYLQHGEGSCFLRRPAGSQLRPVVTGWFAEFADLATTPAGEVGYGPGPERFAGSTYDPTSHYRAARVLEFFDAQGLTPPRLRQVSRHQVGRLASAVTALDVDPAVLEVVVPDPDLRAGFLALRTPHAGPLQAALRERGVLTDHRGDVLRLGPAPYLRDDQLDEAVALLAEALRGL
ncbi:kynureninase/PvdN C-terminal domain-containing protein [Aquipuribacter sp. MA13-6]|uniref:kynureninase/PvdN C-terminal domain-containing protein n=1 Tax=unclassified Aquipuribacter TaxID=2635084 RepID=UPI003EEB99E7